MLRFPTAVDDAYRRSAELVLEIGADELRPEVAARLAARYGVDRAAQDAARSRLARDDRRAHALPQPRAAIRCGRYLQMQPWFIAQQIEAREAAHFGLDPAFGVDRHFASRAAGSKPVVGLETAESQIQVLAWLPRATQEQLLRGHARARRATAATAARASRARGRAATTSEVERIVYRSMHESPQLSTYYERMLFGRNESMTQRLASLARDGKLRFVVVGAGHMVGERGIPALLRDYGFRVDRVDRVR